MIDPFSSLYLCYKDHSYCLSLHVNFLRLICFVIFPISFCRKYETWTLNIFHEACFLWKYALKWDYVSFNSTRHSVRLITRPWSFLRPGKVKYFPYGVYSVMGYCNYSTGTSILVHIHPPYIWAENFDFKWYICLFGIIKSVVLDDFFTFWNSLFVGLWACHSLDLIFQNGRLTRIQWKQDDWWHGFLCISS